MAFSLPVTETNYTSLQEQKDQIQSELEDLQQKLEDMEARDLADSTSDAFFQIKRQQGNLQQRLNFINDQLSDAEIVEDIDTSVVSVGTRVTLHNLDEDTHQTFDVVGTIEADPEATRLTRSSPLGEAIIGHSVDDEVSIITRAGIMNYRIISIEATPTE